MDHWLLYSSVQDFGNLVVRSCLVLPSIWFLIFPPTLLSPLSGLSNDEDYVWWKLHPERASQELLSNGGAGSLQGGQKLHRLALPQRPLRGSVHAHHRGFPPQGLQHTGRHVPAGHPGHLWESPFPCHEEAFHPNRWESRGEGHKDECWLDKCSLEMSVSWEVAEQTGWCVSLERDFLAGTFPAL